VTKPQGRTTEAVGTFECPYCGVGFPHPHAPEFVERARRQKTAIAAFERTLPGFLLDPLHSSLRYPNWLRMSLASTDPQLFQKTKWPVFDHYGKYAEPHVDALWQLWWRSWEAAQATTESR
jgi:hypothetical protein